MTRRYRIVRLTGAVAGLVVAGAACNRSEEVDPWAWPAVAADTAWVNIEGVEMPAGIERFDSRVVEAYVFAAKHPEVLRYMPCYCGCESPTFAHENNYDCFINGIDQSREVPRVSPDQMGFS